MEGLWCCSIQAFSFSSFSAVPGGGIAGGVGGGDDLVGQEHILVGIPEEARLPVIGLLGMLERSSGRIPIRGVQICMN